MKRVIHTDDPGAVFVGQAHAGFHGAVGDGLPELASRIPDFHRPELARDLVNLRAGHATADFAAEQFVEVERLDGIVCANPVRGR